MQAHVFISQPDDLKLPQQAWICAQYICFFLQFDTVRHPPDRQSVDTIPRLCSPLAYIPPPSFFANWKPYFENPLSMICSLKLTRPLDRVRNLYRSMFSAIKSGDFS